MIIHHSLQCRVCYAQLIGRPRETVVHSSMFFLLQDSWPFCTSVLPRRIEDKLLLCESSCTYTLISTLSQISQSVEMKTFDLYLNHHQTQFLRWRQLSLLLLPASSICHAGHKSFYSHTIQKELYLISGVMESQGQ